MTPTSATMAGLKRRIFLPQHPRAGDVFRGTQRVDSRRRARHEIRDAEAPLAQPVVVFGSRSARAPAASRRAASRIGWSSRRNDGRWLRRALPGLMPTNSTRTAGLIRSRSGGRMAAMNWLFKEEPSNYSFDAFAKDKKTVWSGVKNPGRAAEPSLGQEGRPASSTTTPATRRRSSASRRRAATRIRIQRTRPARRTSSTSFR